MTLPAARAPAAAVVLISGSGPNDKDETEGPNKPFADIANGLAIDGIASIRYDKRTHEYPAQIDPRTFTATQEYVPDAVAAVQLLISRPEIDAHRIFVLGHSQGATFAPKVAAAMPARVAGLILLAPAIESVGPALLRQMTYLATLPDPVGAEAKSELVQDQTIEEVIDDPRMAQWPSTTRLPFGTGPAYWLDLRNYDPVAIAKQLPQPLLILQGDRDYQVTVADDLVEWERGLAGRGGVAVRQYANADHLFLDGTGPPSPAEYSHPAHVDPQVIADIAAWTRTVA